MYKKATLSFEFLLGIILITTSLLASVPRRHVVEDHTGAWCGWCVRGNFQAEDMLLKFGIDKFIPVAFHNGDNMCVGNEKSLESTTYSTFVLQGYPSGIIDREIQSGFSGYPIDPDSWPAALANDTSEKSDIDVSMVWNIDKTTKQLTATVTANILAVYSGQLAFNLYIVEDNVTGSGTGWDQHNYIPQHPEYIPTQYIDLFFLSATITGYKHQNVLIDALGGAWGDISGFPSTSLKAGDKYQKTFTADLSTYPIQNIDNVWLVGLVQQNGTNNAIMNAIAVNKKLPKPTYHLPIDSTLIYATSLRNSSKTYNLKFSNNNNFDLNMQLSTNSSLTSKPSGWTIQLPSNNVTVPANSNFTLPVTVTLDNTPGYGQVGVIALVKDGANYLGGYSASIINILSDGVDNIIYDFGDGSTGPIQQAIAMNPTYSVNTAILPFNNSLLSIYPSDNFKLAIFPESFNSRGLLVSPGYTENDDFVNIANNYIDNGKPLLITSIDDLFFIGGNTNQLIPNSATQSLFNDKLGITGFSMSNPFQSFYQNGGNTYIVKQNVTGINGDDITDNMNFYVNDYNSSTYPYYSYFLDQINPITGKNVTPILNYNISTMETGQTTAAVKIQTATNRDIYCGFSFDLISDATVRTTLLGNMITWLLTPSSVIDFNDLNSSKITVCPNPVVGDFRVDFESTQQSQSTYVYIVNAEGNKVMNIYTGPMAPGSHEYNVGASSLASGKYYVVTSINGIMSNYPFVVTK